MRENEWDWLLGMRLECDWLVDVHAHRGFWVGVRYVAYSNIYSRL